MLTLPGTFTSTSTKKTYERGYDLYITNAVWDDTITIRLLDVYQNADRVHFEQELIEFEWSGE